MKEEQEDKALSELFRHKLENAEVIPSPGFGKMLMRRVAWREFLRFNPARFNAWYAGGAAVAGAALVIILTTNPGKNNESESSTIISKPTATEEINESTGENDVAPESSKSVNVRSRQNNDGAGTEKPEAIAGEPEVSGDGPEKISGVLPPAEVPPVTDAKMLAGDTPGKNKLQTTSRKAENIINASVTEGCAPLKVLFSTRLESVDSSRWSFGDGGYSFEKDPEWIFDIEGEYEVILRGYAEEGRQTYSSVMIKVHPNPVARFEITPENAVIPGEEITFLNYSNDAAEYRWNFGDGNTSDQFEPKYSYSRYGNYTVRLIAYSAFGCSDSLVVQNAFGSGYYVRFPNAFIPNPNGPSGGFYTNRSDEDAFVFHPVHSGVAEYQLRIFNRRGMMVFESSDVNTGWDGYYKGQLVEPGVYIWKVRGNYINGEPFTLMGDVTLFKGR
ncbi:MAG: PKD domain-containing protein [Bacteroidota bacterium]